MKNTMNIEFTNKKVNFYPLTHSSITTCLFNMFNPLRLKMKLHDEQYAEGFVNGFLFSIFQTSRDFIGFVRMNPVTWTLLVAKDFWLEDPVDQSFFIGATPIGCIKECKSIFLQYPDSKCHDMGLTKTLDYFIEQLSQQETFSFSA